MPGHIMDFAANSIIWTLVIGLVVGAIAKLLMPGKDPGGCIITMLLGIAGAFVGTWIGRLFAGETIPPFLMAGTRFLIAGLIMYALAWSQGIGKSSWANWRTSLIIGACLLLGGNGGVTISEKYIDSGLAAIIVTIVPIYIVVLGWATGTASRPTAVVW